MPLMFTPQESKDCFYMTGFDLKHGTLIVPVFEYEGDVVFRDNSN